MEVEFLTPLGAAIGLTAVVPLAIFVARERRARSVRSALRLAEPSMWARIPLLASLAAVPALLALAAAQPVVAQTRTAPTRIDAEAFVVIDISRSMLASSSPDGPTRFARARQIAVELGDALPDVPMGVASLTDRVLPHLFPTTDRRVLRATLERTLDIERPGPAISSTVVTYLDALEALPLLGYFKPAAEKRLVIVLTDGESRPLQRDLAKAFQQKLRIETIFVHVWKDDERVHLAGVAEAGYASDKESREKLDEVASLVGGRVVAEAGDVKGIARDLLGSGPTEAREQEGERVALMPYLSLATILPLGLVLYRRNL